MNNPIKSKSRVHIHTIVCSENEPRCVWIKTACAEMEPSCGENRAELLPFNVLMSRYCPYCGKLIQIK